MARPKTFSAGIIPVFYPSRCKEPFFLLLRVYNYWDFPKGEVEPHEDPLRAALRELSEETGIGAARFSWGESFVETAPYSNGKIARYYLGQVSTDEVKLGINPVLGTAEHHEFRWCTYSQAKKLLGTRVGKVLDWGFRLVS